MVNIIFMFADAVYFINEGENYLLNDMIKLSSRFHF